MKKAILFSLILLLFCSMFAFTKSNIIEAEEINNCIVGTWVPANQGLVNTSEVIVWAIQFKEDGTGYFIDAKYDMTEFTYIFHGEDFELHIDNIVETVFCSIVGDGMISQLGILKRL